MARRAANPSEFQATTYAIEDLIAQKPINRDTFLTLTAQLETSGLEEIKDETHKPHYIADRAAKTLGKVANIETEPPLTAEHQQSLAQNLGHWTVLADQTAPQPREVKKPTPTRGMSTSQPKR